MTSAQSPLQGHPVLTMGTLVQLPSSSSFLERPPTPSWVQRVENFGAPGNDIGGPPPEGSLLPLHPGQNSSW